MKRKVILAVTLGDPGGIGPEISLKAACRQLLPGSLRLVIIGSRFVLRQQARKLKIPLPPKWHPGGKSEMPSAVTNWEPETNSRSNHVHAAWRPGITGKTQGAAAAQWIRSAVSGCQNGWFDGMVTGPICKKSLKLAGLPFAGHTEFLATLTGTSQYAMMLIGGQLRVVLATRHIPISKVAESLSQQLITEAVELAAEAAEWLNLSNRTIGICALNPHAGDQGLIGNEERTIIIPAIRSLRRRKIDVEGPVPADVIFHKALNKRYSVVVAMYHDQALGPLKMIAFKTGVNLTLGLPIVRTSPDHGTAFDIAGTGTADPDSMINAIRLAYVLARKKNPWQI